MAIQHELSSDIAVALLAGKEKDPEQLNYLKEVVFRIHSTLQKMTTERRATRTLSRVARENKKD